MYLRLLPGVAAILFLAGDANAQCSGPFCPGAAGPVRKLWHGRPGILFPHAAAPQAHGLQTVGLPATVASKAAAAAPAPVVGAPGDRLKARLLSEIRQLHELELAGKLTPDQWARLLALIELFVRLFLHSPSPSP